MKTLLRWGGWQQYLLAKLTSGDHELNASRKIAAGGLLTGRRGARGPGIHGSGK